MDVDDQDIDEILTSIINYQDFALPMHSTSRASKHTNDIGLRLSSTNMREESPGHSLVEVDDIDLGIEEDELLNDIRLLFTRKARYAQLLKVRTLAKALEEAIHETGAQNINPEAVGISRNSSLARLISAACGNDAFTGLESVDAIAEEFHQQMASKTEAQLSYLAMRLMEQSSRDPALASKFTAFTKVLRRSFQRQPVHSNRFFNGLRKWSTRTSEQKSELQDLLASIDPQNPEAFLTQPDSQVVTMWGTSTSNSSSAVARTVDFMRQLDTSSLRTKVLQIVIAIIWYEACENVKPGTGEQDSHWRECDWEALYSSCVFAADISLTVFKNTIKPYKLYGHRLNILLKELGWDSLIQFIPFLDLKMAVRGWTIDEEAEAFYDWARDHEVGKDTNSSNIVKPLVDALKKNLPLKAEMQTAIQCSHSTMSRIDRNSKDDESKKPGRKKRKQTVVAIVDDDGYSFPMRRSEY